MHFYILKHPSQFPVQLTFIRQVSKQRTENYMFTIRVEFSSIHMRRSRMKKVTIPVNIHQHSPYTRFVFYTHNLTEASHNPMRSEFLLVTYTYQEAEAYWGKIICQKLHNEYLEEVCLLDSRQHSLNFRVPLLARLSNPESRCMVQAMVFQRRQERFLEKSGHQVTLAMGKKEIRRRQGPIFKEITVIMRWDQHLYYWK